MSTVLGPDTICAEADLETSRAFRVLVVDDYLPWRRFVFSTLRKKPELQFTGEAADGLEAVQRAQELQPDLIVLDIGLPKLNGIEAARLIHERAPRSKIIFLSENRSLEIVEEALCAGASYVVKSHASTELMRAVAAVLHGMQFVSRSLARYDSSSVMNGHIASKTYCHEVQFYADDVSVVDGYARFIESALESGNAVIAVATEVHRARLVPRLEAEGVDIHAAIEQGRCVLLDAADAVSMLTVDDMPDPIRCAKLAGDLIPAAAKRVKAKQGQVQVCGEMSSILLSKGHMEGAIKLEHLWNHITTAYGVHTLCGYLWSAFLSKESRSIFERICADHSVVHGSWNQRPRASFAAPRDEFVEL